MLLPKPLPFLPSSPHSLPTPIRFLSSITPFATSQKRPQQLPQQDPYSFMKEDPIQVCSNLWVKTFSNPSTQFANLTGFLKKFDLWVLAYQRTCAHFTGSFPPKNAIQFPVLHNLLSLQSAVLDGRFLWNKKTQLYIRSPNDRPITKLLSKRKLRALLESSDAPFQDRIVQEVLLLVLEPIFKARFSPKSHAFRPGRNAHTVIRNPSGQRAN